MTAALRPAEQLTFRPRTVDDVAEVPLARPGRHLTIVPEPRVESARTAEAIVHRLPVVHRDEVYRRRRLGVLAVVVGLVLGVVSFISSADATPTSADSSAESVEVVVQPGDTLWAIAGRLAPDADPRVLTAQLTDLAGSTVLTPGQQLVIPAAWLD